MAKTSNVYYFTMNKSASGNRVLIKAICIALTLAFGMSFAATGVMASSGCGMKCCCLSKPQIQHRTAQEQIRSSMGCCSGPSQMPCDLVPANELQLPEITLAYSAGQLPTGAGQTGHISEGLIDRQLFRGYTFDQFAWAKFRLPPLYLQNLSFLI